MRVRVWDSAKIRQKVDTLWLIYREIESCGHVTFESLLRQIHRSRGTIASGLGTLVSFKLIQKGVCPTCGYKHVYSVVGDVKDLAMNFMRKKGRDLESDLSRQEYFEYYLHWFLKKKVIVKERGKRGTSKHRPEVMDTKDIVRFYANHKKS